MLKRTLFFQNSFHLYVRNKQLIVKDKVSGTEKLVPAEDVGYVIFDNKQLSYTQSVLQLFATNNTAVIICDDKHLPVSMMQNLNSHHIQGQNIDYQISASQALKKQLWKQTVKQKILNQAGLLKKLGENHIPLIEFARNVKTGDTTNREAVAAKLYRSKLFKLFTRDRYGDQPNSMLNYAYAILRSATAQAITGSGLLSVLGIHHHNKYDSYRLADDLMEPYRPYIDELVVELFDKYPSYTELTTKIKMEILQILTIDTQFKKIKRPLGIGLSITTASLAKCFRGKSKKIQYPYI